MKDAAVTLINRFFDAARESTLTRYGVALPIVLAWCWMLVNGKLPPNELSMTVSLIVAFFFANEAHKSGEKKGQG